VFKRKPKALKIHTMAEIDQLAASGKPVLIDFFQVGCAPCQVMDGIMNELSREYGESAHIVKADIASMPDAMQKFKIRSTPTLVLLSTAPPKKAKKNRNRQAGTPGGRRAITQRWRASGLVPKDQLARLLENNGALRATA